MPQTLTPQIILAAIAGFEAQKSQIDAQIAELRGMLDGRRTTQLTAPSVTGKPRKAFSAAARKKMALAQKARWSKVKEAAAPPQTESAKPKKRKMSAAGRKAISEATKKRWAAVKAAKKAG